MKRALSPGRKGKLVWRFERSGIYAVAGRVPGRLDAGMRERLSVE